MDGIEPVPFNGTGSCLERCFIPQRRNAPAFLILILGLVAACGQAPIPAALPSPSQTFTQELTLTPTSTATAQSTSTLTRPLESTPTPTPVTLVASGPFSFPEWMKDAHTPILMQQTNRKAAGSLSKTLTFLNARTGEWFELPFPEDAAFYFWFDASHFGFLSNDLQTMVLFDLSTGRGAVLPVPQGAMDLITGSGYRPEALYLYRVPSAPDKYFFERVFLSSLDVLSAYGHYTAEMNGDIGGNPVSITEKSSGKVVWRSNQEDRLWESEFAWSPVDDETFAIVHGVPQDEFSGLVIKSAELQVIDLKTGEVKAELRDDIGNILWSSDGSRILYEDSLSRYSTLGYAFQGAPCIFDVRTQKRVCLRSLPGANIPAGYRLVTTGLYTWSPDLGSIRYMALYYNEESHAQVGNVCIYALVDGKITCPTAGLSEPHGWGIRGYDFSPDRQFLSFCYSESNITNDYIGDGYDALLDLSSGRLITWQNFTEDGLPQCSYSRQAWRPLP